MRLECEVLHARIPNPGLLTGQFLKAATSPCEVQESKGTLAVRNRADLQDAQPQLGRVEGRNLPLPGLKGLRLSVLPLLHAASRRPLRHLSNESCNLEPFGVCLYTPSAASVFSRRPPLFFICGKRRTKLLSCFTNDCRETRKYRGPFACL